MSVFGKEVEEEEEGDDDEEEEEKLGGAGLDTLGDFRSMFGLGEGELL